VIHLREPRAAIGALADKQMRDQAGRQPATVHVARVEWLKWSAVIVAAGRWRLQRTRPERPAGLG
jgi:hypothetical protein